MEQIDEHDDLIYLAKKYKEGPTHKTLLQLKSIIDSLLIKESIKSEFVEIDMGNCNIEFFNYDGTKAKVGGDIVRSWMWRLNSPGLDPAMVRSVEIPTLRYDTNESLKIKVELEPTFGEPYKFKFTPEV